MSQPKNRKDLHLEAVLEHDMNMHETRTGFEKVMLAHHALPEVNFHDIDLSTQFLGRSLTLPFLISSMTGGAKDAEQINSRLAEAAGELGIAMGVGSQRVSIEDQLHSGLGKSIRRLTSAPLFSNFGAAQLTLANGIESAQRAIDFIEADGMFIHLNPMQEALQQNGDVNWKGVLSAIEQLKKHLQVPLIIKEVGFGISGTVAKQLAEVGIDAIDVAGAGGTSWAAVEGYCNPDPSMQRAAALFREWGIPTAVCLEQIRQQLPDLPLIASGGIYNGLESAKAIHLGATLVGQAGAVVRAATKSTEEVIAHFEQLTLELKMACFGTGCQKLNELPKVARLK